MPIRVTKASLRRIEPLRELYRSALGCQIVHDSWHERGFTRSYIIDVDGRVEGYGSVGGAGSEPRDIVKEFFLCDAARHDAALLFRSFADAAGARRIEAQTNDRFLSPLLESAEDVIRHTRLFEDGQATDLVVEGATFRRIERSERQHVFRHELEPVGDWVVDVGGEIVATGGLMFHYNPPYSDLYMEVAAPWRCRGIGAWLVQNLKRVSHEMRKVPAARCAADNEASRRTLERAGMTQCGWIAGGTLRRFGGSTPGPRKMK